MMQPGMMKKPEQCVMVHDNPQMVLGVIMGLVFALSVGWLRERMGGDVYLIPEKYRLYLLGINAAFAFFLYTMFKTAKVQNQMMVQMAMGGGGQGGMMPQITGNEGYGGGGYGGPF
jgi:hypothetical protein